MEARPAASIRSLVSRGFYRLRLPHAGPSYACRQSRNLRRLERLLEDRRRALNALVVELGFFFPTEPLLTRHDHDVQALQSEAAQREVR